MSFDDLRHVENLARIVGGIDPEPPVSGPRTWGPASWWRMGLVVFAALIAGYALWQVLA